MLKIKPICENCSNPLPNESNEAMICSFECTFCSTCVSEILCNVCPNCGGGFEKRPSRPKEHLNKHPIATEAIHKPLDKNKFNMILEKYKNTIPNKR